MSEAVIVTRDLTKKYGDFTAVDHLDLTIVKGEVFGLLGPNGAGKTTIILMMLGLTEPHEGLVKVLGFDPQRHPLSVKARVGYMPDQVGFYDELTGRENLVYTAKLNGFPRKEAYERIEEVLALVGLVDVASHRVATYSRGMRQRLGVADVMLKRPEIIIMDEPTQGLDPEHAHEFLNMVRDLKKAGITILLSSHLLEQVQAVCDRVGLFSHGKMVLNGTVPQLARQVLGKAYRVDLMVEKPDAALLNALKEVPGVVSVDAADGQLTIETNEDLRAEVARVVVNHGGRLLMMGMQTQSLDAIYTKYFEEVEHGFRS
jgi:ABC-2 type transport system ATP-binding protein